MKTASRRISLPLAVLILCLLLPQPSSAQPSAAYSLRRGEEQLFLTISAGEIDSAAIRSSLDKGSEAEIRFRVRLYRQRTGAAALLGETLLYEDTAVHRGGKDIFSRDYLIHGEGKESRFASFEPFMTRFTAQTIPIPLRLLPADNQGSLLFQIEVIPQRLAPPFTLLRPFLPGLTESTSWQRVPLKAQAGGGL